LAKTKTILGIDPGTSIMGYGIIEVTGSEMKLVTIGVITLTKYATHELKLKTIFEKVTKLIDGFTPDELAIEAPFYGKNIQSMLKLGKAQGVAIAAALNKGMSYTEYMPKKIKMSITGSGTASKEQVAGMLKSLLNIKDMPKDLDATDGLAAAVCHHFSGGKQHTDGKAYSGWGAFLKENPKRKG
jgi:crossover junction endodeoxyribonuclease RuvC